MEGKIMDPERSPCHIRGMEGKIMDPELGEELARLYAKLPEAHERAAAAFKTGRIGSILEGDALKRFLMEEERVATIVRRIKEIQDINGEPRDG
jgi:hypothetical protein